MTNTTCDFCGNNCSDGLGVTLFHLESITGHKAFKVLKLDLCDPCATTLKADLEAKKEKK